MFVSFRRQVAVLTVLVAGLVLAVPVSAVEDPPPAPSYMAAFDACENIPPSNFSDAPSHHAHADDIDCIAYYGITRGTSATTFSPDRSVTREQMALFLIRLAHLVGIDVPPAGDTGFADIGNLGAKSQATISQLAQMGVAKGTTPTTFSPSTSVTREQMAIFLQQMMNKMEPVGYGTYRLGYTPADVINTSETEVASPFTDLGEVSNATFDAVTQLYELGVVTGISETRYEPSTTITRATMADFLAALLDHSRLRPEGLTIRASPISDFGPTEVIVMVSYRDADFAPIVGQSVDVFGSQGRNGGLDTDGGCVASLVSGDCIWRTDDRPTGEDGDIFARYMIEEKAPAVFYAWIGDQEGAEFDADDSRAVTAVVTSPPEEAEMKVTSGISEHADGNKAHIARTGRMDLTVQLVDRGGRDVARSGIEIEVGLRQLVDGASVHTNTKEALLTTNRDGRATFRLEGVEDDRTDSDQSRVDRVTFRYRSSGITKVNPPDVLVVIEWGEEARQTHKAVATAPDYVVSNDDREVSIRASVAFYDQYGSPHRAGAGQKVGITIDDQEESVTVGSRGVASRTLHLEGRFRGFPVTVSYDVDPVGDGVDLDPAVEDFDDHVVQVVTEADASDDDEDKRIHTMLADRNRFTTETGKGNSDANLVYRYKASDSFVADGRTITIDRFEELLTGFEKGENLGEIEVVTYDPEGSSVFRVILTAGGIEA